jgi:hypothetical protein
VTKHDRIQFAIDRRDIAIGDLGLALASIRTATLAAQRFFQDQHEFENWWATQNFRRTDGEPLTIEDALQ